MLRNRWLPYSITCQQKQPLLCPFFGFSAVMRASLPPHLDCINVINLQLFMSIKCSVYGAILCYLNKVLRAANYDLCAVLFFWGGIPQMKMKCLTYHICVMLYHIFEDIIYRKCNTLIMCGHVTRLCRPYLLKLVFHHVVSFLLTGLFNNFACMTLLSTGNED